MNRTEPRQILHLCMALCAVCSVALMAGCKGNTSAAAIVGDKPVPPPPHVQAYSTHVDPRDADPVTSPVWTSAHWFSLVSPIGTERTTEGASGALLFDQNTLYVAVISQKTGSAAGAVQDFVSFYLDSSEARLGGEIMQFSVSAEGRATCTWIRDAEPPVGPKEDGTADVYHPLSKIPADGMVKDLAVRTGTGVMNGQPVWTAVLAIPMQKLPMPLRAAPTAGSSWKVNLLRTTVVAEGGNNVVLQSNLSPVYVGQQAVAPYRMATVDLTDTQVTAAQ